MTVISLAAHAQRIRAQRNQTQEQQTANAHQAQIVSLFSHTTGGVSGGHEARQLEALERVTGLRWHTLPKSLVN